MFGQNKQPFSFSLTSTPAANQNQPAQTSTPFSFGASSTASTNTQQTTSNLLGSSFTFGGVSSTTAPSTSTSSTNLFGASNLGAGVKTSSANLFGASSSLTSSTTLAPAQPASGSLFNFSSSTSTTPSAGTTTQQPSSLFSGSQPTFGGSSGTNILGASTSQSSLNKPATPSFSFSSNTTALQPSTNLFGQSNTQASTVAPASTATPATSGFNIGNTPTFNFNSNPQSLTQSQTTASDSPAKSLFGGNSLTTQLPKTTSAAPSILGVSSSSIANVPKTTTPSFGLQSTTPFGTPSTLGSSTSVGTNLANLTDSNKPIIGSTTNLPQSSTTNSLSSLTKPTTSATFPTTLNLGSGTGLGGTSSLVGSSSIPNIGTITTTPASTLTTTGPTSTVTSTAPTITSAFPSLVKTQPDTNTTTTTTQSADVKPVSGLSLGTSTSTSASTTAPTVTASTSSTLADTKLSTLLGSSTDKTKTQTLVNAEASLPNVSSFPVPSLVPPGKTDTSTPKTNLGGLGSLGGTLSGTTSSSSSSTSEQLTSTTENAPGTVSGIIRTQSIKDQPLPQPLLEAVENFKKHLEETRKIKELNLTFNSRTLNQNINEIISVKQRLTQTGTDLQHNINEANKLKDQISKELRHVDICENLKNMPLGLQYDTEIWNEYFLNRVQLFQNKMRTFKTQFEQLEGYFKVHDNNNMFESQKIVDTLKATHRNLLNEAANLKLIHEEVEALKKNYLSFRRNLNGDTSNIFENDENQSQTFLNNSSSNRI